jgi:hypothetical protein
MQRIDRQNDATTAQRKSRAQRKLRDSIAIPRQSVHEKQKLLSHEKERAKRDGSMEGEKSPGLAKGEARRRSEPELVKRKM